jgi:nitroreductase
MDTWDAIRARRNVRQFTNDPLPDGDVDRILEAGRRAPSSRNWQPWDFILVTERDQLRRLSGVWRAAAHVADAQAAIALVGPIVTQQRQRDWLWFDLGQATMSMMLAAADRGIGTGHAAVEDQPLARQILGHPADHECLAIFSLGYPRDRPLAPLRRPDRRPFDEVVHRGYW